MNQLSHQTRNGEPSFTLPSLAIQIAPAFHPFVHPISFQNLSVEFLEYLSDVLSFTHTPSLSTSNLCSGSHYSWSNFQNWCPFTLPYSLSRLTSHSAHSMAFKPKGKNKFSNSAYTLFCFLFGSFSLGMIFLLFCDSFCVFYFCEPTSSQFCILFTGPQN